MGGGNEEGLKGHLTCHVFISLKFDLLCFLVFGVDFGTSMKKGWPPLAYQMCVGPAKVFFCFNSLYTRNGYYNYIYIQLEPLEYTR